MPGRASVLAALAEFTCCRHAAHQAAVGRRGSSTRNPVVRASRPPHDRGREPVVTAKRFPNIAQGRRLGGAPWVTTRRNLITPEALPDARSARQPARAAIGETPVGFVGLKWRPFSQGAPPSRRPWAWLSNAYGVVHTKYAPSSRDRWSRGGARRPIGYCGADWCHNAHPATSGRGLMLPGAGRG
jgi:hypothetical protein